MNPRKSSLWRFPVLMLVCLLASPVGVRSQCVVTNTTSTAFLPTLGVTKTLSAATPCVSTGNNAFSCFPNTSVMTVSMLNAVIITTATTMAFCNWDCGCDAGTPPDVTIDGSDGLPVELMDFGFEDEESQDFNPEP